MSQFANAQNVEPSRIAALDGLRGIAILLVMEFHFWIFAPAGHHGTIDRRVDAIIGVGWMGVDLFFVLSGFLITGVLLNAKSRPHYFRNFYARRVLRIFPVYYGYIIVGLIILANIPAIAKPAQTDFLRENQLFYWTFTSNLQSFKVISPSSITTTHVQLWSLAVEEQFYLVWPLVALICGRRGLLFVCLAAIVAAPTVRWCLQSDFALEYVVPGSAYYLTPGRLDALAIGALLAMATRSSPTAAARLRAWSPLVIATAATALTLIFFWRGGLRTADNVVGLYGLSLTAVLFGGVVAFVVTRGPGHRTLRFLTHPSLTAFGRYSYAMYVVHALVLALLAAGIRRNNVGLPSYAGTEAPATAVFALIGTATTFSIAWLSWHIYERPILRLKRFFS